MIDSNKTEISDLLEKDGVLPTSETEETEISEENIAELEKIAMKEYNLRKLGAKDLSPMIKILKKIDIKQIKELFAEINISELMQTNTDEEASEEDKEIAKSEALVNVGKEVVIDLIPLVLDSLDNALPEINKLLASVAEVEVEEIENLELDAYFNLIFNFINKEEFKGFIKVASKYLNLEK